MKDKVRKIIEQTFYTNLNYPVCGNRNILAANLVLNSVGICDIDIIYQLAKTMEENSSLELEDEDFNNIYENFVQLLKTHRNKPFEY
jgi:hypothetical protein